MSKEKDPKPKLWTGPKDPEAELDEALRELGDDLLKQEIPERLLRVLRSAKEADKSDKRKES